ncbi:cyclic nucleotide-binding domain-containing protein [Chloropicon primus]|nr:cyclic nucleotide-binding domain-containing protein [Chloropicon primus]
MEHDPEARSNETSWLSRIPSCFRRERKEKRYDSLPSMDDEMHGTEVVQDRWKSVLIPLMWRYKKTKLSKHAILQMELQAIGVAGTEERDKGLIHPSSRTAQVWRGIMALTVLCCLLEVPFICAFTPLDDDGIISRPEEYFHLFYRLVVDLIFVADIFVNFKIGYHKLGAVVMNQDLIERHYLRHGFVRDVVAALPILVLPLTVVFSIMCSHGACPPTWVRYYMRWFRLLQLVKVGAAMEQLQLVLEVLSDATSTLLTGVVRLLLFFIILTHWFTCIWFWVQVNPLNFNVEKDGHEMYQLTLADSWVANASPGDPAISICVQSFMDGHITMAETIILYINCYYWASSANDAYTTQNTSEKFIAILAQILIENGFMAYILATLISSIEEHSRSTKKHTIYRSKIDAVNDFMKHEGFPGGIIDNVREYYKYVWLPQQIDFTEANLHDELPHYLRTEVMSIITRKVLLTSDFMTKFFSNNAGDGAMGGSSADPRSKTAWIKQISEMLVPKFFIAQQYVMRQGDIGTELYIVKQGKIAVEIDKDDGSKLVVAELGPGSVIGDVALLGLNTTRTASIRTITNCIIFELTQEDMQKVWDKDPTLKVYMLAVAKEHLERRKGKPKEKEDPPGDDRGGGGTSGGGSFPSTSGQDSAPVNKWKFARTQSLKRKGSPAQPILRTESEEVQAREIKALEDDHPNLQKVLEPSPPKNSS